MKKTVIAIVAVVLLVAVAALATHRWGYTEYGAVYYYDYPYFWESVPYPPGVQVPYAPYYAYQYQYPAMNYPSPIESEYMYGYGLPTVGQTPRSSLNQLCGVVGSEQYGCVYGLVCDYTRTDKKGLGLCVRENGVYPSQSPQMSYPMYFYD